MVSTIVVSINFVITIQLDFKKNIYFSNTNARPTRVRYVELYLNVLRLKIYRIFVLYSSAKCHPQLNKDLLQREPTIPVLRTLHSSIFPKFIGPLIILLNIIKRTIHDDKIIIFSTQLELLCS